MSSRDRQKASDIFKNTDYVFSTKVSFDEAFPMIEDIKVVVEHRGHYGVHEWNRVQHYGKNIGEYVECTNSICYNGGFSVGNLVRIMVASKQTHLEKLEFCQGYEGSPKGKRRYRSCTNSFNVTIDIKYKSETAG
jgi:hypothetical protein